MKKLEISNKKSYSTGQLLGLVLGVVLFAVIQWVIPFNGLSPEGRSVLATLAIVGTWWISEALNTGITGLLPLVLFPLTGALTAGATAAAYGNNNIFMFFGGFAIALALEKWNLHNRIALSIINFVGTSLNKLIIGLMLSSTFISMWVSNTATALMLLPIALAIGSKIEELLLKESPDNIKDAKKFKKSAVMAIGFGAIIGGSMTLIGTPTNISLASFSDSLIGFEVPFAPFMLFELPIAIVQLIISAVVLNRIFYKTSVKQLSQGKEFIQSELSELGKMSHEEKIVSVVFVLTIFMWVTLSFIWKPLIPGLSDTIVSIIACIALFAIPNREGSRILNQDAVTKMPWSVILMLMGGMAIAAGFTQTDLAEWIGSQLLQFENSSPFVLVLIVTFLSLLVTQVAPNTATGTIMIPLAASVAAAVGVEPFYLMTAAALGSGFAATLPSGTPLMGIIYGQGDFEMKELVKVGITFVLISFVMIVLVVQFLLPIIFKI